MPAIGTIFSDNFTRANSGTVGNGWIEEGSINAEILSNKLRMVGSASSTQRIRQPILSCGENFSMTIRFTMTTLGAGTLGPVVGTIVDLSAIAGGGQRAYCAQLIVATGASQGKVALYRWNGSLFGTALAVSASAVSYAAGDVVEVEFTQSRTTITATGRNITQGGSVTTSFTISIVGTLESQNLYPGPRNPAIWIIGGTCDVSQFTWTNNANNGAEVLIVGDSITAGSCAADVSVRWSSIVVDAFPEGYNFAAPSAVTANIISGIGEAVLYAGTRAILMIGGNDILMGGYSLAGTMANYASIVASLEGAGFQCWHCLPTPRTPTNLTTFKNALTTAYAGTARLIDTWTPLLTGSDDLDPAYDSGDGVHPNTAGHALIASTILAAMLSAPAIADQPDSATKVEGESVTFIVVATGIPTPTYQWRKDGVDIVGATSTSYNIPSVVLADAGDYDVVVTNSQGSVTSTEAVLTVNPAGTAPTITVEPSNQSYTAGDTFHLSVTATGDPTLTYQWRKDGVNISGAVDSTLYFAPAELGDAGSYDVVVTNPYGSDTSVTVTVAIAAVVPTSGSASANGRGSMAEMQAALKRIQAPVPMQGFDAGGPIPMTGAPMPNTFIPLTGTPTAPSPVPHFFPW